MRIGYGYDVHPFVSNRPLIVGGVTIPFDKGLKGHSDADVLIHAIIDAMLGALALGDIGSHFPDHEEQYEDADSRVLLRSTRDLIRDHKYEIGNIDATIVAEHPKLRPYITEMRTRLADDLGVEEDRISIKATTSEKLGFIGREEGMAAVAVVLLNPESA